MSTCQVWVLEEGEYENRGISGVYDSAERAMGAVEGARWTRTVWTEFDEHYTTPDGKIGEPDFASISHYDGWDDENGTARITPYEVSSSGPLHPVDRIVEQRYRDRGWDYIDVTAAEADRLVGGKP